MCIGVIFAIFHSVGNFPLTMLLFMSVVTDTVMAGAAAFNSLALVLSAPVDLSERRVMSALYTVCCLISGIESDVSNLSLTKCLSCVLLLSCVLAVTSVFTGYVCEVFVESISNVFRFCDFLFSIPDDTWRSCFIPWTHWVAINSYIARIVLIIVYTINYMQLCAATVSQF